MPADDVLPWKLLLTKLQRSDDARVSYAEVMAGSNNGPILTAGDAANSLLIQQVVNGKMPKQGPKLLPAQIRTLSDWVAAGAPNN